MQPEHLVLCGGLQSNKTDEARTYRLNLTEPGRNVALRISDVSRTLVTNLPDVLIDLLELAAYVYCADGTVRRGGSTMAQMGRDWRRRLRFIVPVRLPELWSSISPLLIDTLSFCQMIFTTSTFNGCMIPPHFKITSIWRVMNPTRFRPDEGRSVLWWA
jgi:hypothetical protein